VDIHPRRRPLLAACVSLTLAIGALGVSAACATAANRLQFGHMAGYIWVAKKVDSVSSTFTVPTIRPGSPARSLAATWIGAQAPSVNGPFIQIGVNELRLPHPVSLHGRRVRGVYFAFWSDTAKHFHAVPLFIVGAGDRVAVSLRRRADGWKLAIADASIGVSRRFLTHDEARGSFDWAEWLQEDPTANSHRPLPYPRLSRVSFEQLRANSAPPGRGLLSQWLTISRGYVGPTKTAADAFSAGREKLGAAAAQFWRLAFPQSNASVAFYDAVQAFGPSTPVAQISAQSASYAAALRANIRGFERAHWPPRLRPLVRVLIKRTRVALAVVITAPQRVPGELTAWRRSYDRTGRALSAAAFQLRLGLSRGPVLA